jgi:hypothetical protein
MSLTLSRRRGDDLSTVGTAFFNHGSRSANMKNGGNLVNENKNYHIVEHFLIFCKVKLIASTPTHTDTLSGLYKCSIKTVGTGHCRAVNLKRCNFPLNGIEI